MQSFVKILIRTETGAEKSFLEQCFYSLSNSLTVSLGQRLTELGRGFLQGLHRNDTVNLKK